MWKLVRVWEFYGSITRVVLTPEKTTSTSSMWPTVVDTELRIPCARFLESGDGYYFAVIVCVKIKIKEWIYNIMSSKNFEQWFKVVTNMILELQNTFYESSICWACKNNIRSRQPRNVKTTRRFAWWNRCITLVTSRFPENGGFDGIEFWCD